MYVLTALISELSWVRCVVTAAGRCVCVCEEGLMLQCYNDTRIHKIIKMAEI